jgi:hypothetical protein
MAPPLPSNRSFRLKVLRARLKQFKQMKGKIQLEIDKHEKRVQSLLDEGVT